MRKNHRFAFLVIGGLGLLAAVAPGLAATLTDGGTRAPAAGQGVVTVQGFEVTDIEWVVNDDTAKVTLVSFTIVRDSRDPVDNENAVVRVRLEGGEEAAWQACSVVEGDVTCTLSAEAQMLAADLEQVNIIAFDKN